MQRPLPDFALEVYLGQWEFAARYNLTASDAETLSIAELLAHDGAGAAERFLQLGMGYIPTRGTDALREAIAATYEHLTADDIVCFAGAEEPIYWAMQTLVEPGDHVLVTVPNYQAMEAVPRAAGADVEGIPLFTGEDPAARLELDVDRIRRALRPSTRLVAVNFPNNPTGFVPAPDTWRALVSLCDERGIRLFSDEVYRGIEREPGHTLPQAADLSANAISLNVMSKAYGLPGLRVGWVASRDATVLDRRERAKHYTAICTAGPSEHLAAVALRNRAAILERNRSIVMANLEHLREGSAELADWVDFEPPDGGCVAFPRYRGRDGVESFCKRLVEERGVVLLPSSIFRSDAATVPPDRFRIGLGRRDFAAGFDVLRSYLKSEAKG